MNAEEKKQDDGSNQPKSRSGHEFLSLSRCENCYKHQKWSTWGGDGESSSEAEDSGPEMDSESEAESLSSSCSEKDSPADPEPDKISDQEPEPGGATAAAAAEPVEETPQSREDGTRTKGLVRRAPLVKSFSLPASFTPRLTPLSQLPRPHTVISTLHLQVLTQTRDDNGVYVIERRQDEAERGRREADDRLPYPQTRLPWQQRSQPTVRPQHQLLFPHQHLHHVSKQQQHQHFPPPPPPPAQGQRLPLPPLPPLPVLHPPPAATAAALPQAPLHALPPPQPWWHWNPVHFPPAAYGAFYSSGQLPR